MVVCIGHERYLRRQKQGVYKSNTPLLQYTIISNATTDSSHSPKMLFSNVFTATALLAAQAAAHGAVTSYEIDGVKYPG